MKPDITCFILSIVLLCHTVVFSQKPSDRTRGFDGRYPNRRTLEGSGSSSVNGPGTDDEDVKLPSPSVVKTRRPVVPLRNSLPVTRLPAKPLPRDEGSGSFTVDSERPKSRQPSTENNPRTVSGPLDFSTSRGTDPNLPTKEGNRPCDVAKAQYVRNMGKKMPYDPLCRADGYFETTQCASDCFCVNRITGIILENTRAVKIPIRCEWVVFRIEIPLQRKNPLNHMSKDEFRAKFMSQLRVISHYIRGRKELRFDRYITPPPLYEPVGMKIEWKTIGHAKSLNLKDELMRYLPRSGLKLGEPMLINVTTGDDKEVRKTVLPGGLKEAEMGDLAGDEPRERPRMMRTADASKAAGKPGNELYSVRTGDSKSGDELKPASGASPSKKEESKKMATLFEQPGIIAAIIGGGIAAFLLAILLILFCIYRIRKKDEGSYALEEPKKTPVSAAVYQSAPTREYYA